MKNKIINVGFLGSPHFAAEILESIHAVDGCASSFFSLESERKKMKATSLNNIKKHNLEKSASDFFHDYGANSEDQKVAVSTVFTNAPKVAGRGNQWMPTAVAQKANALGLPLLQVLHLPKNLDNKKTMQESMVKEKIASLAEIVDALKTIDVLIVVAFGQILPEWFFRAAKLAAVNLHFSMLPKFRGASPIESAVLKGQNTNGVTLQCIETRLDAGDILLQEEINIQGLSKNEILAESVPVCLELLHYFFCNIVKVLKNSKPQKEEEATYCYKVKKSDGCILARHSLKDVQRKFLAYKGWPNIYFLLNDFRIEILDFEIYEDNQQLLTQHIPTGSFLVRKHPTKKTKHLLLVLCDGAISIKMLKKQGKNAVDATDFINGFRQSLPTVIDGI